MSSLRVNFYDWMKAQKVSSSSLLSSLSSSRTSVCHQSKKTRSFSPCILLQHPNNGYALPGQKSLQGTLGSHRFPPEWKPLKRVSWPHAFLLLMPPFLGTTSTHTTFFTISGEPTHGSPRKFLFMPEKCGFAHLYTQVRISDGVSRLRKRAYRHENAVAPSFSLGPLLGIGRTRAITTEALNTPRQ